MFVSFIYSLASVFVQRLLLVSEEPHFVTFSSYHRAILKLHILMNIIIYYLLIQETLKIYRLILSWLLSVSYVAFNHTHLTDTAPAGMLRFSGSTAIEDYVDLVLDIHAK